MRSGYPALAAILLLGVRALAAPDFPAYSVTDLKALGVWPVAMNESGQVVGRACCGRQSVGPVMYAAGEVRDLGLPAGGYTSFTPEGINDSGWVVGYAVIPSPDIAVRRYSAALHDGNDWKVIDTSAFGTVTLGTAVNNAGQVIGTTENKFDGRFTAWLYDGGTARSVGPAFISHAGAISENGEVVGNRGFDFEAYPWAYRDGRTTYLPGPGKAFAVNDAGTVLIRVPPADHPGSHTPGYYAIIEGGLWSRLSITAGAMNERSEVVGSAGNHAALYRAGTTVDLGTLGGGSSQADSINNRGQIAGWSLDATGGTSRFRLRRRRHAGRGRPARSGVGAAVRQLRHPLYGDQRQHAPAGPWDDGAGHPRCGLPAHAHCAGGHPGGEANPDTGASTCRVDVGERERQQLYCERRHLRRWLGRRASDLGRSDGNVRCGGRCAICDSLYRRPFVGRSDGVGALRGSTTDRAPVRDTVRESRRQERDARLDVRGSRRLCRYRRATRRRVDGHARHKRADGNQ